MTTGDAAASRPKARGRRPGGPDTRAAIIEAARREFAAKGYDGASLRGIARAAGVDPALIHHYFVGKANLFAETLDVPIDPATLFERVLTGPRDRLGWRLIETFLFVWDPPERRVSLVALLRSSMTSDEGAVLLREFLGREIFGRVVALTGVSDPQLRGALAASQVLGMAIMRYVVRAPGIVDASSAQIIERLGPILQFHLVDSAEPSRVDFIT